MNRSNDWSLMGLCSTAPRTVTEISSQILARTCNFIRLRCSMGHFQSDLMMRGLSEPPSTRSRITRRAQKAADGMKKLIQVPFSLVAMERKWLSPLLVAAFLSILLVVVGIFSLGSISHRSLFEFRRSSTPPVRNARIITAENILAGSPRPPKLAYMISGTIRDGHQMRRTLQALYHPHNYYLLHLDREAPESERAILAKYLKSEPVFQEAQNVFVVEKANLVTYKGPTMIAATLHGAAILLRKAKDWDWFINLSASDYPLVTQDDLLHVFSYLPKDLNFIEHSSDIVDWKQDQRVKPIIIDPGLYEVAKSDIFWMTQRRAVPDAFRLFTGSAWVALTRSFMEYCNSGWDNLPRTVLMYYANFVSSPEGYFHTVLCNSEEYRNTTVNHDLHFIQWDNPPRQHPQSLTLDFFHDMTMSGAPFARKFRMDDPVLDKIDQELLRRPKDKFSPGGWCAGSSDDPCTTGGNYTMLMPGPGAQRLENFIVRLLSPKNFRTQQCIAA